ncbi:MAG: hypothetical protein WD048_14710 [Chitinophagales bacterium]
MRVLKSRCIFFAFLLMLSSSCIRKDLDNLSTRNWSPEIAVPLINSSFFVQDIIKKFETGGFIKTDSTQLITVVYTGKVVSISGENLIPVPDQSFTTIDSSSNVNFAFPGGDLIHFIIVKSGTFNYRMLSNRQEDIRVTITIPKATKNGAPLRIVKDLPYTGSPIEYSGQSDLSGYLLDLTGSAGNSSNTIEVKYQAELMSNGQRILLDEFEGSFENIRYNFMEGFFGLKNFEKGMDTIVLDIFKNWISGTVFIENPMMNMLVQNSFGMPLELHLTDFNASNRQVALPISGSAFNTGYDLGFPDGNSIGSAENTDIVLNSDNSNLQNVLAIAPNRLNFGFNVTANTNPFTVLGFLTDESQFTIDVDLEIPLQGRIDNLVLADTFAMELDNIEEIDYADFKLFTENTFPVDLQIQVYFTDDQDQIVDSLLSTPKIILASGIAEPGSDIRIPVQEETIISFGAEKLDHFFNSSKMTVNVRLASTGGGAESVRFLSTQSLSVKLGVISGLSP